MNGLESANPYVQPGDIISIPEADTFFVTGAVVKPGAYPMVQKITLTQAVALAGGVNGEGARNRVRLVREEPGKETRTETVFNMDEIHRRKIPDIVLRANDIVEVPGSTMRVASRNILGVGINMLTALPYFIIP
jgi:polysaccharide export outer membrane protein